MNMPRKTSLIEQTKEFLKAEIAAGKYRPGDRIEPVRQLTGRLGVSHVTAATALQEMAKEGWIETKTGCGSFVAAKLPVRLTPVAPLPTLQKKNLYFFFIHDQETGSYHSEVLCSLQREAEQQGWSLKVGMYSDTLALANAQQDAGAVGIVHGARPTNLVVGPLPVINYGMNPELPDSCCVTPDNYQSGFLAGKLLLDKGIRDVFFVTVATPNEAPEHYPETNFTERYNGLTDFFHASGLTLPPPLPWSQPRQICEPVETLLREVREGRRQHLSLAVGNRVMAAEICRRAGEMGLETPRDLSIVTFICRGGMDMSYPLTTFDFSREEMGRQIGQLLQQALAGLPLPSRVQLPMHLLDEGSL